jgi:hypothetical protein
MATRTLNSAAAINTWMTHKLVCVDDCRGSVLNLKYPLQQPDETGCNWSADFHLAPGPDTNLEHAMPIAKRIVDEARAQFNLPD